MKHLKKLIAIFLIVLCLIPFTGCSNKKEESTSLIKISYTEFIKKVDNKETFVLEIMRKDCSACISFKPKLTEFLDENNLNIYYIDTNDFSEDEDIDFSKRINYTATPTIVFITEGEEETVSSRIVGNVSKDKLLSKFKANGIIKEK